MKLRVAALVILIPTAFAGGAIWAKLQLPPYDLLRGAYTAVTGDGYVPVRDLHLARTNSTELDSIVLPLVRTDYSIIQTGVEDKYGGICSAYGIVIVANWRGIFFGVNHSTGAATQIKLELPISEDLQRSENSTYQMVHDVECREIAGTDQIELFVSYDHVSSAGKRIEVARITISDPMIDAQIVRDWEVIFQSQMWPDLNRQNLSGRLELLRSGDILVSLSQFPWAELDAQDERSHAGKSILVDPETGNQEVFSSGHRNMQGLFEASNGNIYGTEHGEIGGDELNIIVRGGNYGWPLVSHGVPYSTYGNESDAIGRHEDTRYFGPVFSWVPSIAVSNILEVMDFSSRWNGDLLLGTLKDRSLYRIRLQDRALLFAERIWIGDRIRDLTEVSTGQIAVYTDSGTVLFLEPNNEKLTLNQRGNSSDFERAAVLEQCSVCHHFGATNETHSAPSLDHLLGRGIASDSFDRYSSSLKQRSSEIWDPMSLKEFLSDPEAFAPGTGMPRMEMSDSEIDELIEVLSKI